MVNAPEIKEIPELPEAIKDAALDGKLVLFVGAGVSRLAGLPSWEELADKALRDLIDLQLIDFSEYEQLKDLSPKKKLSIAEIINREKLDLRKHLTKKPNEGSRIYEYLNKIGCVYVTTNYDNLLSCIPKPTSSSKATTSIDIIDEKDKFLANKLDNPGNIIHLHGSVNNHSYMVLTSYNYLEHYRSKNVQHFLRELFKRKTVLFIGYGLEETEILEHFLRKGNASSMVDSNIKSFKRFALQPYFKYQKPLFEKLHKYYNQTFGVYLMGYSRDSHDYKQLELILKTWSTQIQVRPPALTDDLEFMDEVLNSEES